MAAENIFVRSVLLGLVLMCVAAAGHAGEVHKCATPTGITYQGVPCEGAELPTSAAVAIATKPPPPGIVASAAGGDARMASATAASGNAARTTPDCDATPRRAPRPQPWRHASICIGMTDDEVLNLPGWGRPAKILRTRAPREWREEWTYDARAAAPRQLHFVNGKLAAMDTDAADTSAPAIATLASN